MDIRTFTGQLYTINYNSSSYESNVARQGWYGSSSNNRVGLIYFDTLADTLSGKYIEQIKFDYTADSAGSSTNKILYFYWPTSNGLVSNQSGASYLTGTSSGVTGSFYNTSSSITISGDLLNQMRNHLSAGYNTLAICVLNDPQYHSRSYSENYLSLTSVSIQVTYGDRVGTPTTSTRSVNLGESLTIYTNRTDPSATHTIEYAYVPSGSNTSTIIEIATNVANSVTWTPPLTLAEAITDATSFQCTIISRTYINNVSQGSRACTVTLFIPDTVVPTINSITLNPTSNVLQNITSIAVTINATGNNLTYRTAFDGYTYIGANFSAIPEHSGTLTFSTTVTDARGRTATATQDIAVLAYTKPTINNFIVERCDATGNVTQSDGVNVRYSFSGTVNASNTGSYRLYYKTSENNNWTSVQADYVNFPDTTITQTNVLLTGTFSNSIGYNFKLELKDNANNTIVTQIVTIASKSVVFDVIHDSTINLDGISFGQIASEAGVLASAWPIKITDQAALATTQANLGITSSSSFTPIVPLNRNENNLELKYNTNTFTLDANNALYLNYMNATAKQAYAFGATASTDITLTINGTTNTYNGNTNIMAEWLIDVYRKIGNQPFPVSLPYLEITFPQSQLGSIPIGIPVVQTWSTTSNGNSLNWYPIRISYCLMYHMENSSLVQIMNPTLAYLIKENTTVTIVGTATDIRRLRIEYGTM